MTVKTINICGICEENPANLLLNLTNDEFEKVAVYSRIEHMAPEVFWRKIVMAGIKSYEVYGVL